MTKTENTWEDSDSGQLLSECFAGSEWLRQGLRLGTGQTGELVAAYPTDMRSMGRSWYEITFQGMFTYGN